MPDAISPDSVSAVPAPPAFSSGPQADEAEQKTDGGVSLPPVTAPADSSAVWGLFRSDQFVLAILLLLLLGLLGFWWLRLTGDGSPPLNVEHAGRQKIQYRLDLNAANAVELQQLEGIGRTLAQRIVRYRAVHGPFHRIEELRQVSGIGPKTLEKLRPLLRIGPPDNTHKTMEPPSATHSRRRL